MPLPAWRLFPSFSEFSSAPFLEAVFLPIWRLFPYLEGVSLPTRRLFFSCLEPVFLPADCSSYLEAVFLTTWSLFSSLSGGCSSSNLEAVSIPTWKLFSSLFGRCFPTCQQCLSIPGRSFSPSLEAAFLPFWRQFPSPLQRTPLSPFPSPTDHPNPAKFSLISLPTASYSNLTLYIPPPFPILRPVHKGNGWIKPAKQRAFLPVKV